MHYALVLLALGALLALHELGHLVAARLLGVRVPRFVFGFGPPLVSFRLWGTQYVLAAVPLGATAHIQGMNPHRADAEEPASFGTLGPLKRMAIILAGPLANYVLALGILFSLYTSGTHVVVPLTVGTVQPGSEAARAQLLPGDRIVSADGQALRSWSDFVEKVAESPGRTLALAVERHGEPRAVQVRPRPDERGAGRIGVSQQYVYREHAAGEALGHSFAHTGSVATEGLAMLVRLVQGPKRSDTVGPGALMRQESSDAASSGADALLRTLVAASVALALLTMLPVPGLDGGRVLLLMVEAASGRRLPTRVETVAQTVGFLTIAAVILVMAGAEIRRALPERPAPAAQAMVPSGGDAGPGTPPQAATGAPSAGAATPGTRSGGAPPGPATVAGVLDASTPAANATVVTPALTDSGTPTEGVATPALTDSGTPTGGVATPAQLDAGAPATGVATPAQLDAGAPATGVATPSLTDAGTPIVGGAAQAPAGTAPPAVGAAAPSPPTGTAPAGGAAVQSPTGAGAQSAGAGVPAQPAVGAPATANVPSRTSAGTGPAGSAPSPSPSTTAGTRPATLDAGASAASPPP
ncbi:site-2 protease family protein [Pyxidicoccus xibeiensis]|uniref:site-2 protease family protein n=1 Tax=Pyxidicoccus xibeiensis TaxID=2906759 RepID=UPI0020A72802|nr:site-2 protease family protein [Pyxidicoccus xibeiensis]MCP3141289.1 site-2 protease family protein [Pyxidicoccus xibeiensis]